MEHLGFAEALEHSLGDKKRKSLLKAIAFREFDQKPSQPLFFSPLLFKTKKGGVLVLFGIFMIAS